MKCQCKKKNKGGKEMEIEKTVTKSKKISQQCNEVVDQKADGNKSGQLLRILELRLGRSAP